MAAEVSRLRLRRAFVGAAIAAVVVVGHAAAQANSAVTISPDQGAPGTEYAVTVECGVTPAIYQRNTQDAGVQMTLAPYAPPYLSEISPSTWRVTAIAHTTDDQWEVSCDGVSIGTDRFDAESPHLWIGPRPYPFEAPLAGRTQLEGTDCPDGTQASVRIDSDSTGRTATTVTIDQFGDWNVRLPVPNGDAEMRVVAVCGSVTYPDLLLTTTSTVPVPEVTESTESTEPSSAPSVTPLAPPAEPISDSATFTG